MSIIDKVANAGKDFAAKTGSNILEDFGNKSVAALIGISAEALENVITSLQQPSLCFIPIKSESLAMERNVDIGTTMLISQADQKKDYLTDNTAPRPRVWTGSGYISSLSPMLENGLLIKPTVQVQQAILDAAADSRQAVKFKTDTGEIVDVLVQRLRIASTTKGAGVKQVTYTVQEVKVLQNSVLLGTLDEVLGKTAVGSIPARAITNLGQSSIFSSTVVNVASKMLGF